MSASTLGNCNKMGKLENVSFNCSVSWTSHLAYCATEAFTKHYYRVKERHCSRLKDVNSLQWNVCVRWRSCPTARSTFANPWDQPCLKLRFRNIINELRDKQTVECRVICRSVSIKNNDRLIYDNGGERKMMAKLLHYHPFYVLFPLFSILHFPFPHSLLSPSVALSLFNFNFKFQFVV